MFDVGGKNNAPLLESNCVNLGVGKAGEMQVISNMLDIEVCIEQRIHPPT